jgi:dTDP-4-amino-4,6-dideoxygalactose transaminase
MTGPIGRGEFLPFHLPDTGDEEVRMVAEAIRSEWITTGPKVKRRAVGRGAVVRSQKSEVRRQLPAPER